MPRPGNKTRLRLRAVEGGPSSGRQDQRRTSSPARRLRRWFWTGCFWCLTVGFTAFSVPVALRPGDIAQHDYVAEVEVLVEDKDANETQRRAAADRVPCVMYDRPERMLDLPERVAGALHALRQARRTLGSDSPIKANLGRFLTARQMEILGSEADAPFIERLLQVLRAYCPKAAERGVIDKERRRRETEAERAYVQAMRKLGEPPERRDLHATIGFPDQFRTEAQEKLQPVFGRRAGEAFRQATLDLVVGLANPTLDYSDSATHQMRQAAERAVPPVHRTIHAGRTIVLKGEVVTEQQVHDVRAAAQAAARRGLNWRSPYMWRRLAGVSVAVLLIYAVGGLYVVLPRRDIMQSTAMLAALGCIGLLPLVGANLLMRFGASLYFTPFLLSVLTLAIVFGPRFALGIGGLVSLLLVLLLRGELTTVLALFMGSAVGAAYLGRVRRRPQLIEAGFLAAAVQALSVWALGQLGWGDSFPSVQRLAADSSAALGSSLLAGFLLSGALPYIERLFLVVTDLSLLEWSDRNQPLLRRLALEAPGSFHHSMVVGNLAEAAADAIGGNALLARAGAYMHDVGKLAKPMYFVENIQGQPNPHNSLSPMLSTLIITAHTRDGADIADEYRLPRQIRDIVEQHHGTTCVEYFYNEAVREAERGEEVDRDMFRYRGPKPLSAEAGIVLLADSVESATRSLDDPTPARIQNVVSEIVRRRLMDGQLEESGLTLTDVHRVEQSLVRGLLAHLHHRVKYPDPVETDLEKASRARVS